MNDQNDQLLPEKDDPSSYETGPIAGEVFPEQDEDYIAYLEEEAPANPEPAPPPVDIDAALASVSSLPDAIAEQDESESTALDVVPSEETALAQQDAPEPIVIGEPQKRRPPARFISPKPTTLKRGQLASIVPALTLIGIGTWLTFSLASDTPPERDLLVIVGLGFIGVMLLAYWVTSQRWARGALFIGLSLLFITGALYYPRTDVNVLLEDIWPLGIVAIGAAAVISALLSPLAQRGPQIFTGFVVVLIGLGIYTLNIGTLDDTTTNTLMTFGPIVLGIAVILLIVPALFRRRS